jgi:hypothetical protein
LLDRSEAIEGFGQRQRRRVLGFHAQGQRLEAAVQEKSGVRVEAYPEQVDRLSNVADARAEPATTPATTSECPLSVSSEVRKPVRVRELFDRSIFIGRHVDTREYGTPLPPLRRLVNSLFEHNVRTPLEQLQIHYEPIPEAGPLNEVFGQLSHCWNTVTDFARRRLGGARVDLVQMNGWREFPPALQMALVTLDRIIDSVAWMDSGDVRSNFIEPQLAYVLQRMQYHLQQGLGCGHGLVAVLSVGDGSRPPPPR